MPSPICRHCRLFTCRFYLVSLIKKYTHSHTQCRTFTIPARDHGDTIQTFANPSATVLHNSRFAIMKPSATRVTRAVHTPAWFANLPHRDRHHHHRFNTTNVTNVVSVNVAATQRQFAERLPNIIDMPHCNCTVTVDLIILMK